MMVFNIKKLEALFEAHPFFMALSIWVVAKSGVEVDTAQEVMAWDRLGFVALEAFFCCWAIEQTSWLVEQTKEKIGWWFSLKGI